MTFKPRDRVRIIAAIPQYAGTLNRLAWVVQAAPSLPGYWQIMIDDLSVKCAAPGYFLELVPTDCNKVVSWDGGAWKPEHLRGVV